jgi:hypothetical protein
VGIGVEGVVELLNHAVALTVDELVGRIHIDSSGKVLAGCCDLI